MAQPQGGNKSKQWQIYLHQEERPVACSQWRYRWPFASLNLDLISLNPFLCLFPQMCFFNVCQVRMSSSLWNWSTGQCWSWEELMDSSATTRTPTRWMLGDLSMTSSPCSIAMELIILKVTNATAFLVSNLLLLYLTACLLWCYRCGWAVLVCEQWWAGVLRWWGSRGLHSGASGARTPRYQRQKWQILTWRPGGHTEGRWTES